MKKEEGTEQSEWRGGDQLLLNLAVLRPLYIVSVRERAG